MKKCCIAFFSAVLFVAACADKKTNSVSETSSEQSAAVAEDIDDEETIIDEEPMPLAADELFDDFLFNFAANRRLQLDRIEFPLTVNSGHKQEQLERSQWKMENFFMRQDYYTLIFDSQEQMEIVKDTSVQDATVEKIFLDDDFVRQYVFSRKSGRWMLCEIRNQTLPRNVNAPFLSFYKQFVADSLFQRESLAEQISFTGPDPDDDFQQIEGVITPDFWEAFAPEFPTRMLYNIVYGHPQPSANEKILVLRGIANGLEVEITFQLENGRWKLTKLLT
ncbi:MAG: DUF4348 domain-containing protein [Prevotella sp.]|nr:DUF4348 domain-containing protein [Prevotella sp.]